MIDRDQILYQKRRADKFKLLKRQLADKYTPEQLRLIYNGIGSADQPEMFRQIITQLHPDLATAAFIHDIEWHQSDHTFQTFKKTNQRFLKNGLKIIEKKYGKYDPRRYIGKTQAYLMYRLLDKLGFEGYKKRCNCDFCKGKLK